MAGHRLKCGRWEKGVGPNRFTQWPPNVVSKRGNATHRVQKRLSLVKKTREGRIDWRPFEKMGPAKTNVR